MNRAARNWIPILRIVVFSALLLAVIVLAVWVGVLRAELKRQKQAGAEAENALQQLEEQIQELERQQMPEEIEEPETVQKAPEETPSESAQEEKEVPEQEEVPAEEPALDLRTLEAGTRIDAEKMDLAQKEQYFLSQSIEEGDAVYQRIIGKSYVPNDDIDLRQLRYLKVLHYDFEHRICVGEMIVNKKIAAEVLEIFEELFEKEYEIERMYLIDNYWAGDADETDTASVEENNTSAFCYRQMTDGKKISKHAYGLAIDINPQQNPYVYFKNGQPKWYHENANDYIRRDTGYAHVITKEDLCYRIFSQHGFEWGGDWKSIKDYQHFEKN